MIHVGIVAEIIFTSHAVRSYPPITADCIADPKGTEHKMVRVFGVAVS